MRDNTIELGDSKGRTCKIEVWTPSNLTKLKLWNSDNTRYKLGDWRAIDKGLIRYNSGDVYLMPDAMDPNVDYLYIGQAGEFDDIDKPNHNNIWPGIILRKYQYWNGTYANGSGTIERQWALGFAPGAISWSRIDD